MTNSTSNSTALRRATRQLLTLFLIGTLTTGCQTTYSLPDWQGKPIEETAQQPHEKCRWPDITAVSVDGDTGGFLNRNQLLQLKACRDIATGNHDIAQANADAVDSLIDVVNATNEIGKKQTALAEFQLNELEQDRREAKIEAWSYKGLLAIVLIAVAL